MLMLSSHRGIPTGRSGPARPVIVAILAILAVLIAGCAPVYYPNMGHAPLFRNGGEVHGSMNITGDGFEAMGAVSPVRGVGVIGDYAWGSRERNGHPPDDHDYRELGACYYMPTERDEDMRLEVIGGFGLGHARSYKLPDLFLGDSIYDIVESEYQRYIMQGNIGTPFRTRLLGIWGEGGASVRISYVRFTKLRLGDNPPDDGIGRLFVEPSFFVRYGHPVFVVELQGGWSQNVPMRPSFDYRSLYMSFGFHVRLGGGEPVP